MKGDNNQKQALTQAIMSKQGPPLPKHLTIIQAFQSQANNAAPEQALIKIETTQVNSRKKLINPLPTVSISLVTPSKPSARYESASLSIDKSIRKAPSFHVKNPRIDAQSTLQRWLEQEWRQQPEEYLALKSVQFRKYKSNIYILQRSALKIQHWYFKIKSLRQRAEQIQTATANINLSTTTSFQSRLRPVEDQYQVPLTMQEKELESIRKMVKQRVGDYSPIAELPKTPDRAVLRALKNSASRNKLESSACVLKGNEDFSAQQELKRIKFKEDGAEVSEIRPNLSANNELSVNPTLTQLQTALDNTQISHKDRQSMTSTHSFRNSKSAVAPIDRINCIAESYEEESFYKAQHIKITNSQMSLKAINQFGSQKSGVEVSEFSKDNISSISGQRKALKPSKEILEYLGGNEKAQRFFEGHKREREFMRKKASCSDDSFFMLEGNSKTQQSVDIIGKVVQNEETKVKEPNRILDRLRQNKMQSDQQSLISQIRALSHSVEGLRRHNRSNAFLGEQVPAMFPKREQSQDKKQPEILISQVYTAQVEKPMAESPVKQLLTYQNSARNSFGRSSKDASPVDSPRNRNLIIQEFSIPAEPLQHHVELARQSVVTQPENPALYAAQPAVIFESTESIIEASQMFDFNGPPAPDLEPDEPLAFVLGKQILQPLRKNKSLDTLGSLKQPSVKQALRKSQQVQVAPEQISRAIQEPSATSRNLAHLHSKSVSKDKTWTVLKRQSIQMLKSSSKLAEEQPPSPLKKSPKPASFIPQPSKVISPINTNRERTPQKGETVKTSIGKSLNKYKDRKKSLGKPDVHQSLTAFDKQALFVSMGQPHFNAEGQLQTIDSFSASGEQALNKASFLSRFTHVAKTLINGHSPASRSQQSISPSPTPRIIQSSNLKRENKQMKQLVDYKQLERPNRPITKPLSVEKTVKTIVKEQKKAALKPSVETPVFPESRSRQPPHTSIFQILKKNKSFDKFEPLNLNSNLTQRKSQEYDALKEIVNQPRKPQLVKKSAVVQNQKDTIKRPADSPSMTFEEYKVLEYHKQKKSTVAVAITDKKRAQSGQDWAPLRQSGYMKSLLNKYIQQEGGAPATHRASIDVTPAKQPKEQLPQALSSGVKHNFHHPSQSTTIGIAHNQPLPLHSQKSSLFTLNDSNFHRRQQSSVESIHHSPEFAERVSYLQSTDSARGKRRDRFIPQMQRLGDVELSNERQQLLNEALQKSVVMNVNSLSS